MPCGLSVMEQRKEMKVFDEYAEYYDLLYRDKDYSGESAYVHSIIENLSPPGRRLLDLGSGTGRHGQCFRQLGYQVHGIERSEGMLAASKRLEEEGLEFSQGDIRELSADLSVDVVISLFHVISYQVSNLDLARVFSGVSHALSDDGLFLFDAWYGPAVLTDQPSIRRRKMESDTVSIERASYPTLLTNQNRVDVRFEVEVTDRSTDRVYPITENHSMRYLFIPEVELLLNQAGMKLLEVKRWMSHEAVASDDWYALFVAQKVK